VNGDDRQDAGVLRLRLYVTPGPFCEAAIENVRRLLAELAEPSAFQLEILDVLDHPARAWADRVMATPLLIRLFPAPNVRVLGSMSNRQEIASVLGLPPRAQGTESVPPTAR
jgi:circadian clock protein KaiB